MNKMSLQKSMGTCRHCSARCTGRTEHRQGCSCRPRSGCCGGQCIAFGCLFIFLSYTERLQLTNYKLKFHFRNQLIILYIDQNRIFRINPIAQDQSCSQCLNTLLQISLQWSCSIHWFITMVGNIILGC